MWFTDGEIGAQHMFNYEAFTVFQLILFIMFPVLFPRPTISSFVPLTPMIDLCNVLLNKNFI